ncbi:hypothetical protein H1Z61_02660 [Bacillus aquiflavi]|uniref:Uncharacterized protein n=1 Tax=Bacillus aquiflavi TaxID=2672567 RepID=A0A6B3VY06_9BACI|nr:hypothetical protein [Bacillus aquiflavi]MBA4536067.1 hypothetical protein [Bacillus aquiflavi]NEY80441.1 hypothetical protein [Bacillus aquiflavi]
MDGQIFYWFSWIYWTITTFFVSRKCPLRLKQSIIILLAIIISPYYFSVYEYDVYFISLLLIVIAYTYIAKLKQLSIIYFIISSLIIAIAYVSFNLFELYAPIWLIFKREWMLSFIITFLAVFLHKKNMNRFIVVFSGTIQGEMLYSIVMKRLSISYPIGSLIFIDLIAVIITLLFAWYAIEQAAASLSQYFTSLEKEKQKLL